MIRNLMKVLSNLFGNNTKINADTIAIKDSNNEGVEIKDYIDAKFSDSVETPTNEFLNGRRVYSKRLTSYTSMNGTNNLQIAHGIKNYKEIWVDMANSFYWSESAQRSLPLVQTFYTSISSTDRTSVYIDGDYVYLISNGGWGTLWQKVITLKYTKK